MLCFVGTLWPRKIINACRKIWQTLSNAQKDNVVDMMKVSFQQYTAELRLTDEQDALDLSLWESWGTRGFKDAADAVRTNDTHKGIYVRHRDSGEHLVADLVLLEAPDQEAIRKAWSALSESKQQDVALEVDKQFQRHLSKIGVPVDEDDVPALRNEWAKGHMLDII